MDCHEEVAILERRLKRLAGPRSARRRRHRPAAAHQVRRREADDGRDRRSGRADRHARVARARRAAAGGRRPQPAAQRLVVGVRRRCSAVGLVLQFAGAPVGRRWLPFVAGDRPRRRLTGRRALAVVRAGVLDINVLMVVAVAGAMRPRRVVRGGVGRVPVRAGAAARSARDGARARRHSRADGSGARRGARPARRRRPHATGGRQSLVGDIVIVRPGEKIPLDGRVSRGRQPRQPGAGDRRVAAGREAAGDEVFAGTINGRGALDVRVTRLRRDSTLARIIHLVERAQAQRAPSQAFVDRFARIYTPVGAGAGGRSSRSCRRCSSAASWATWFYRALVLLVISCPCALVISTPVSIVSALAAAARKGVLIKGGAHLERLAAVRCVAFDKTGTLTTGGCTSST